MQVQNQQENLGRIIARAWADPFFKQALKSSPRTTLASMGVDVLEGVEVVVVEDTPTTLHLTLPVAPAIDAVSDEDLNATMARNSACLPCKPGSTGCQTVDWGCK